MRYTIIPTNFLLAQLSYFDEKTKRVIFSKKELIASNPFRYKAIETQSYSHVFSVKFSYRGEDKRLIYVIIRDKVFLCFILDRSHGYKDLENHFKKIGRLE
jgi:hypothetical protein